MVSESVLKLGTDLPCARADIKVGIFSPTTSLEFPGGGNEVNLGLESLDLTELGKSMLPMMLPMLPELPLEGVEVGDELCGVPDPDLRVREGPPTELEDVICVERNISDRGGCYGASIHTIFEGRVEVLLTVNFEEGQSCLLSCWEKCEDVTLVGLGVQSGVEGRIRVG